MAVERNSSPLDIASGLSATLQNSTMKQVAPNVAKFYEADGYGGEQGTNGQLLSGILATVTKGVNQVGAVSLNKSLEETYLRGAAAAGTGQSLDAVQSNIFTKDWATTGFNDTRAKLNAADLEAQTSLDMIRLREQSPQKMAEYLAERRGKVLEGIDGMSLAARQGMLTQQLTSEQSAIKTHSVEHQKFIIDQLSKAASTSMSTSMDALDANKTNPDGYTAATTAALGNLVNNVMLNPALPQPVREKLTIEAMQAALDRDHQQLFQRMKDTKVPVIGPDGKQTESTMFSQLAFDDQVKLSNADRASKLRTITARSADYETQTALMKSEFENQNAPAIEYSQVKAFLDTAEQDGLLKVGQRESMVKSWADYNSKKQESGLLSQSYAEGDSQTAFNMGKTEADQHDAWMHTQAVMKRPEPQVIGDLLSLGINKGYATAFKSVGERTRSAVAQLGTANDANGAGAKMLNTVMLKLDEAERAGRTNATSAYLSSFSDEDRAKIMTFRESLKSSRDPLAAADAAVKQQIQNAELTGPERAALSTRTAASDAAYVAALEPRQLLGTIGSTIASWMPTDSGADAAARLKTGVRRAWFEDTARADAALAPTKEAYLQELRANSLTMPYASDEVRQRMAGGAVAARTVVVPGPDGNTPLVIPRQPAGSTLQKYFGVDDSVRADTIGAALSAHFKPQSPDNRISYSTTTGGQVQWTESGPKNQFLGSAVIDPKEMKNVIDAQQQKVSDQFQASSGKGITKGTVDTGRVTYNGDNTGGIDNNQMLQFRSNLVKHEAVRNTPYQDDSGKIVDGKPVMTAGVGVSSHNPHYIQPDASGKLTDDQISTSFMKASNSAANSALSVQRQLGMGQKAFPLFAELAYQSGDGFATKDYYQPFLKALQYAAQTPAVDATNNAATKQARRTAAIDAFKSTPAFKSSHEARRNDYLSMINSIME